MPRPLPLPPPARRPAGLALARCLALGAAAWALGQPLGVAAAGLDEILQLARDQDAQLMAARQAALAGREKTVQGRAGLLPTLTATANVRQNHDRSSAYAGSQSYDSHAVALTLNQPLWRPANRQAYLQGQLQTRLAEQQLQQAEQALRLRVARAYFEVLQAEDAVATLAAQKDAFAQQLAQAKRTYEVGLAPITDVTEAQSRHDLTLAQQIAARNDLELKKRALEKSINRDLPPLNGLDPAASVEVLASGQIDQLRDAAPTQSLQVQAGVTAEQIARAEIDKQRAGHSPTVDLVASASHNRNLSVGAFGGSNNQPLAVGVEIAVPLYQGGVVDSRVREAAATLARTQAELDEARRQARLDARQALLGVESGSALTTALRQAVSSAETQVKATRRGFEVGVRTRVDVLNAEQQLYTTQRDLSAARYQTLIAGLQLRAAAGSLGDEDLRALDRLLKPR